MLMLLLFTGMYTAIPETDKRSLALFLKSTIRKYISYSHEIDETAMKLRG